MFFSERMKLEEEYQRWRFSNGGDDCAFNVITFLSAKGLLREIEQVEESAQKDDGETFARQIEARLRKLDARPIDAVARMIHVRDDRIRAEARAEAIREMVEKAVDWWHQDGEDGGPSDLRAAMLADHVSDAGKMMARVKDVETVRAAIAQAHWNPERAREALAALDRIVVKEE